MNAATGQVRADKKPQDCPNGCGPMWRRTERDAGNDLMDRLDNEAEKRIAAEARLALVEPVADLLRHSSSGTAMTRPPQDYRMVGLHFKTEEMADLFISAVAALPQAAPAQRQEGE
jgi:hypothetical protein